MSVVSLTRPKPRIRPANRSARRPRVRPLWRARRKPRERLVHLLHLGQSEAHLADLLARELRLRLDFCRRRHLVNREQERSPLGRLNVVLALRRKNAQHTAPHLRAKQGH
eukprot:3376182-Pleurochrysis_carterae.AAC.1